MTASSDRGRLDRSGRRALITGASQWIGWAIARRLAEHGARAAVNYPDPARRPVDLGPLGPGAIRVNSVAPGLTDTAQPRGDYSKAELAAAVDRIPLGRLGQPEDVADAVL